MARRIYLRKSKSDAAPEGEVRRPANGLWTLRIVSKFIAVLTTLVGAAVMRGTYELRRLENVLTAGQWPEWYWCVVWRGKLCKLLSSSPR